METITKTTITVETAVNVPAEKAWKFWTEPEHIMLWNNASDDWHTPKAENNLWEGGSFSYTMAAKDGSFSFDFAGVYDKVKEPELIEYTMADGRKVKVNFAGTGNQTHVTETFEAESEHSLELQQQGWQSILNNFKKYAERKTNLVTLTFSITIHAPAEKVYNRMLGDETYRQWTSEFAHGSFYEGSWQKGSTIHFLGPDDKGNLQGMLSRIKENIQNKFVSIEHLGEIKDGKEDYSQASAWAGALENYTFTTANGSTVLTVQIDVTKNFQAFFEETWPKALAKLKSICEA
jgi:uncharacterized protein YndB with AHSA1/START domain